MRTMWNLVLYVAIAAIVSGCAEPFGSGDTVRGSQHIITIDETRDNFAAIDIGAAFVAQVTRADAYSVAITVDDNVADYVRVSRDGGALRIRLADGHYYRDVTLEARIALPALERLSLSGAASATLSGFRSDEDFAVELSGASSVEGDVSTGDIACELSGASNLTLEGAGASLDLRASGASSADLERFAAIDADVDLSGASSAEISASGTINATLSGASQLEYRGGAKLADVSVSGGLHATGHRLRPTALPTPQQRPSTHPRAPVMSRSC